MTVLKKMPRMVSEVRRLSCPLHLSKMATLTPKIILDIGNSRYELRCMDGSGCRSTFSREQRAKFLDEKTIEKLECLQQQDEIRRANLQNLVACPFCDFVAECLPTEIDREFRCHNPECEEVSCRLCKAKTHVPLSCEEFKRNNGVSERRIIEEARTEALVRTCGKCQCRIIKDDGCNKVTCTACFSGRKSMMPHKLYHARSLLTYRYDTSAM